MNLAYVSTGRVRSNEFRVCWRGISLKNCLGETSEAFIGDGIIGFNVISVGGFLGGVVAVRRHHLLVMRLFGNFVAVIMRRCRGYSV